MSPLILGIGAVAAISLFDSKRVNVGSFNVTPVSAPPIDYGSSEPDPDKNLAAFLKVIRDGESADRYDALLGGGYFRDYSEHPAISQGFKGFGNSHAAGAYQFQPGTWLECKQSLSLPDFGPQSQDAAATYLIHRRGAYGDIAVGDIASAVGKLSPEWQFLTLPRWSVQTVINHFEENGGQVA